MAQATIGIVIGFRRQNNATSDNRLAAGANLTYCSGQVFNILELVRERVIDEKSHFELKRKNMLPEQRIDKSLLKLDDMQARLQ
jgi:hypothetical protein